MQLKNISIPDSQIVYGSIDYQNQFVNDLNINNNPKFYLTRMLNIIITQSTLEHNSNQVILFGLELLTNKIIIDQNQQISLTISPGTIIADNTIINIPDDVNLSITPLFENNELVYTSLVIIGHYTFAKNSYISFGIYLYDNVNNEIINFPDIFGPNHFIYKYLDLTYTKNNESVGLSINNNPVRIDNIDRYPISRLKFIDDVIDYIFEYLLLSTVLDIPYIPPIKNTTMFGITKMFTG